MGGEKGFFEEISNQMKKEKDRNMVAAQCEAIGNVEDYGKLWTQAYLELSSSLLGLLPGRTMSSVAPFLQRS